MIFSDCLHGQASLSSFLHISKHPLHFPKVNVWITDLLCKAEIGFNEAPLLKLHIFLKMKNAMYNVFSCM